MLDRHHRCNSGVTPVRKIRFGFISSLLTPCGTSAVFTPFGARRVSVHLQLAQFAFISITPVVMHHELSLFSSFDACSVLLQLELPQSFCLSDFALTKAFCLSNFVMGNFVMRKAFCVEEVGKACDFLRCSNAYLGHAKTLPKRSLVPSKLLVVFFDMLQYAILAVENIAHADLRCRCC